LARAVGDEADGVRGDATRAGSAADVAWVSTRAGRYRQQLQDKVELARRCAAELDELQDALLTHATAVEARLAQIQAAEQWVHRQAAEAIEVAQGAADRLLDAAGDVLADAADQVEDLMHAADRWRAPVRNLTPGSVEWLDAARSLGWRG
jgi:uncharacterized protein Yka (UPF0111/DUF47 family)